MLRLRIASRLGLAFAAVGVLAPLICGWISHASASRALEDEALNRLTAVREIKAQQIEGYFRQIRDQVISLSSDPAVARFAAEFAAAFAAIDRELDLTAEQRAAARERVLDHYRKELTPRLERNRAGQVDAEALLPGGRAIALQDLYIAGNAAPTGEKHVLDAADDGSTYSALHRSAHPFFRDYVDRFGYYDLFVVDSSTGDVVYSVFKEVDFATSLENGPYRDSNLAAAYRAAAAAEQPDFVELVDYRPYAPSYGAQAAFVASPIFDGTELVAVLVLQMPVERIDDIMTSQRRWPDVGLGESGETYIVGADLTLRSQSRFFIEDAEAYLEALRRHGVDGQRVDDIRDYGSSIGLQTVETAGSLAALRGEEGTATFPDYRGVRVLSAYRKLDIDGLDWAIMSEIDAAEALAPANALGIRIMIASVVLAAAFVLLSLLVSRSLTRPLVQLTRTAKLLGEGDLAVEVPTDRGDEIGDLGRSFDAMRGAIKTLVDELHEHNATLESKVAARTADLEFARKRVQSILDTASDGVIVITPDGTITEFNPEAEKIFGYGADEIIGRSIDELVPDEVRPTHSAKVQQFAAEGVSSRVMGERLEVHGRRKDGELVPAEVAISKSVTDGQMVMTAFVRDISGRKAAEAKLRLQSTALESAAHGIFITDTEGAIQWANPAFTDLTGHATEEVVGENPRILKSGKHDRAFYAEMWRAILAGESWSGEIVNKRRDGSLYTEESIIAPVLDDAGAPTAFVAIQHDITERKKLERELATAFKIIEAQKERMESELNVARDIQMSMLPLIFPAFPDRREFEVHARLTPAREVGGDFYDFFFIDDDRFFFCVGDVSDKGVPAALFMAVTKTLIKARAEDETSTASIATRVNRELSRENEQGMFVTMFLATLDLSTGKLTYTLAGHNPPYIRRADGELVRLAERHGPVLGAIEEAEFGEATTLLDPSDVVVAFTDGVTEAMDPEHRLFGEDRLLRVLEADSGFSTELTLERISSAVREFENGADAADDVTLLALRFVEKAATSTARRLLKLRLNNELGQIAYANDELTRFLKAFEIEARLCAKLAVAVDEILNNIISYGYDDEYEHEIHVVVEVLLDRLVVTISDDGVAFNALEAPAPDTTVALEDREIGGLGILLVRELMDDVDYHRGINRNIITLVKSL